MPRGKRCTRDELIDMYGIQKLAIVEITRRLGLKSNRSVHMLLKEYQIPTRTELPQISKETNPGRQSYYANAKHKLMEDIWESYEWMVKRQLRELDDRVRRVAKEMRRESISPELLAPFLQRQIDPLTKQVVAENDVAQTKGQKEWVS